MTPSNERQPLDQRGLPVPAPLAEYAERLLLSTGLHAEDALQIASGALDPPPQLEGLARALRAGWDVAEEPA